MKKISSLKNIVSNVQNYSNQVRKVIFRHSELDWVLLVVFFAVLIVAGSILGIFEYRQTIAANNSFVAKPVTSEGPRFNVEEVQNAVNVFEQKRVRSTEISRGVLDLPELTK